MTAEQAEVVGQNVAVERLTELRAENAATNSAGQTSEDGTRYGTEGYADRASESTDSCASLAARQGCTNAASNTAYGADGRAGFHGVMERSDFGGVTTRALQ